MAKNPNEEKTMEMEKGNKVYDRLTPEEKEIMDGYSPVDDPDAVAARIDELNRKFGGKRKG